MDPGESGNPENPKTLGDFEDSEIKGNLRDTELIFMDAQGDSRNLEYPENPEICGCLPAESWEPRISRIYWLPSSIQTI